MSVIQVEVTLSPQDLLRAAEQLDTPELNRLVEAILGLKARRQAPVLSEAETRWLEQINQGLPAATQARYQDLIEKRLAETLTPAEHQELLQMTAQVEAMNVKRIESLAGLARLRQVSLPQLMDELGIASPTYVS
jgi:hypothetical protein